MPLEIIKFPHPTLRYRSKPIRRVDAELKRIVAEMFDKMYEARGVGLAANQVDLPLRVFVMNPTGQRGDGEELALINPVLQLPKGSHSDEEGCLSLPGIYGSVVRPKEIKLSAYDISGKPIERKVEGFEARVMMHESDHLDGVLFFDRMSESAQENLGEPLEELEIEFRAKQQSGEIPGDDELLRRLSVWEERYA